MKKNIIALVMLSTTAYTSCTNKPSQAQTSNTQHNIKTVAKVYDLSQGKRIKIGVPIHKDVEK